ncbi:hypothetical protein L596_019561 [Steinernema carpocapsae]|uniref:Uncharacterized protein n=1 Tax=Steinernema carpocapsae TaxID=34508 RepID=A0A4U5MR08_STECR|nr:hypothetical protein L596_019561 [Steinernema carpocapsae]
MENNYQNVFVEYMDWLHQGGANQVCFNCGHPEVVSRTDRIQVSEQERRTQLESKTLERLEGMKMDNEALRVMHEQLESMTFRRVIQGDQWIRERSQRIAVRTWTKIGVLRVKLSTKVPVRLIELRLVVLAEMVSAVLGFLLLSKVKFAAFPKKPLIFQNLRKAGIEVFKPNQRSRLN